jgi:hypothetical protein
MSDLSNEAKARLAALATEEPDAAAEARVRTALERSLGVALPAATLGAATLASTATAATQAGAAATSTAGTAASAAASTSAAATVAAGASSTAPWLIAALVAALGGGGVIVALRSSEAEPPGKAPRTPSPAQPSSRATPPEASALPTPAEGTPAATVDAEPSVATPTTPEGPTRSASPATARARPTREAAPVQPRDESQAAAVEVAEVAPTPPPLTVADEAQDIDPELVCDVDAEGRFAVAAQAHLAAGRAPRALELLEAFTRRCPSGRWSQHTWAVRLGALCALGRAREAEQLRAWHREEYPAEAERLQRATATWCQPRPE